MPLREWRDQLADARRHPKRPCAERLRADQVLPVHGGERRLRRVGVLEQVLTRRPLHLDLRLRHPQ